MVRSLSFAGIMPRLRRIAALPYRVRSASSRLATCSAVRRSSEKMRPRSAAASSSGDGSRPCFFRCDATASRSAISSESGQERCGGRGFLETMGSGSGPEEPSESSEDAAETSDSGAESKVVEGDDGGLRCSSETVVVVVSSEGTGEGRSSDAICCCCGGGWLGFRKKWFQVLFGIKRWISQPISSPRRDI